MATPENRVSIRPANRTRARAAAALLVAGRAATLREGAALAAESVDSGAARRTADKLAAITAVAAVER